MSESYPLFQSAISSAPFGGTMADTSTQTPAGALPQMPQATEAPGSSGNRERAKKIGQDIEAIRAEAGRIQSLKYVSKSHWGRRLEIAMNGGDMEPPALMYKRFEAVSALRNQEAALLQEQRLLEQDSPFDRALAEGKGKDAADALVRSERRRQIEEVNAHLVAAKLPEIPEATRLAFEWNQTTNISKSADEQDPIKALTGAAGLGAATNADFASDKLIPEPLRAAVRAGAKTAEKTRADKKKSDDEKGKYAGFDTLTQLTSAVDKKFDDIKKEQGLEVQEKVIGKDPLTQMPVERSRTVLSKEGAAEARRRALAAYPGAEKFLPNYAEQASAQPTNDAQKDLTPEQKRAALKAKLQGK